MDGRRRRELSLAALEGRASGADAPLRATAAALAEAETARAVVLVEGISDQIAVESLAERQGRDLEAERVVVVPIGGAHAVSRFLTRFGPQGADLTVVGLCDVREEPYVRRALAAGGFGSPTNADDMERLGFFTCDADLEDELLRASGRAAVEALLDAQGDLASFLTLTKQPAWREKDFDAQVRRWLGAGARRKLRYARLLVLSLPFDRIPRPLNAVLAATAA